MKNEIIKTKGVLPYDIIANNIIKILLNRRGSKEVFTSAKAAENYLSSLTSEKQDSFRLNIELKNPVKEEMVCGFPLYIFTPKSGVNSRKKVLYLHGGAFVNQPDDRHFRMLDDLTAKSGAEIFMPIYPKAPSHSFKETYAICEKLYARLVDEAGSENVVFAGDSAGAMLCVTLCEHFKNQGVPLPSRLVLFSLVAETALSNPEIRKILPRDPMQGVDGLKKHIEAWANGESLDSPLIDPFSVDLSILPPTMIFCGMNEIFMPDAVRFAEAASLAGADICCTRYRHLFHCFVLFDQIAAKTVRKKAAEFINK